MSVTSTVYDINDRPWTLTINGSTPSTLNLTDEGIIIEYPDYKLDEPLIIPKFTFEFVGDLTDVEAFGVISQTSHPFTLKHTTADNKIFTWKGFLEETLFNIANTGYKEVISINGISEIEALKFKDFECFNLDDDLVKISDVIFNCLQGNVSYASITYNLSFNLENLGWVAGINWFDEEGTPFTKLDVIKHICTFYSLIFDIDYQQFITISSYSELQRPKSGILNYSGTAHKGIDETFSNSENWLSAEIKDSILKPEDVVVNLNIDGDVTESPYLYYVERYVRTGKIFIRYEYVNPRVLYEERIHVIQQNEFPGWTFPKYDINRNTIAEWWNPAAVISGPNRVPAAGMYKLSYRSWDGVNPVPSLPLSSCFVVKTFNNADPFTVNPVMILNNRDLPNYHYAEFKSQFTAGESQYLLFSGKLGFAVRVGYAAIWQEQYMFNDDYHYKDLTVPQSTVNVYEKEDYILTSGSDVHCPFANRADQHGWPAKVAYLKYNNTMLGIEVKFRDKWWDGDTEDWVTTRKVFKPPTTQNLTCESIATDISDHYPPVQTPLYEDLGRGYALRFGKKQDGSGTANAGTGQLEIRLYVFNSSNQYPNDYYPVTLWLQNFNFNIVDSKDKPTEKEPPKAPVYSYGNKRKPSHSSITNYLMSSYDEIVSFSQVYTDKDSDSKLDKLTYTLPTYNASGTTTNFTTTEKPEEMQLRLIKQLISSQVTLSDTIEFTNFINKRQVLYNSRILVRDGCSINGLMNEVHVNYVYRRMNYS